MGVADGVHVLRTMGDLFAVLDTLGRRPVRTALVVGAGYIGMEMADALTVRGVRVTQVEALCRGFYPRSIRSWRRWSRRS